jgi:polysaccharide export outer membrane protein
MRFTCECRCVTDSNVLRLFVAVAMLAGCTMAQASPQGDAINAPGPTMEIRSSVPSTTSDSKPDLKDIPGGDASVRLGVGDLIELSVYDVPELNTKTRVSDSGDIYLPLVNYVHVDGLTINDAAVAIEKRLDQGGFIRNPHVQIFVDESTSNTASVLGEVTKPGVYPVTGQQTLFSVISAAGGLTDRAGKSITITRRDHPDKSLAVTITHNLEDHPESNIAVFSGDTIMVRRADVIYVVGEVSHPSGFLMDNNNRLTVLQAIALAGGTARFAKLSEVRILRKGPAGVNEVPVPLKKILQAKANDVPLQPEDILFVPTSARKMLTGKTTDAVMQMATAASIVAIRP